MTAKQAPVLLVCDKRQETPALAAVSALGVANTGYGADFARQLKRQRGLRVVMFVADDLHQPQLLEALALLRQRYRSALPACLCFCGETLYQQLRDQAEYDWLARLARLQDFTGDYPRRLIERQLLQANDQQLQRQRRQAELDLYAYMARVSRLERWDNEHFPELMALIAAVCGADISILLDKSLAPLAVQSHQRDMSWSDTAAIELAGFMEQQLAHSDKPILVNLEQAVPYHAVFTQQWQCVVGGSLVIPLRCYQQVAAVLVLGFESSSLAQLDLSVVNLIEKIAEQLRSQLERQLSQQRLKTQYQRLRNTIRSLHDTREQLYHAEKLSSLGELAAGIAHEINNPVAYVMGNFGPLDEYVQSMVQLLELHQQFMAVLQSGSTQEREQLQQQLLMQQQEADLDFILDDVFALVADSREGLERVCDIVKNLRAFARKDDIEMAPVNVCQVLTATLKLVKHQLNGGIEGVNHVDAEAQVSGSAGMLGQVFLNLIQNAIHAMAGGGRLEIASSTAGQRLLLSFSDNGSGMPADVVTRILDPFFTTKEVGKGTGLGLSTVYGIVKKHQGDIQVSSEPGVGTRFELSLPLCP